MEYPVLAQQKKFRKWLINSSVSTSIWALLIRHEEGAICAAGIALTLRAFVRFLMNMSIFTNHLIKESKMPVHKQLRSLRARQGLRLQELTDFTGLDPAVVSRTLSGKRDSRISTFELIAGAMNSSLVVIPNHLLFEVERLLSGKPIGPDDVPTAAELILSGKY